MNYIGIALEVAVDISHILIELLAVNGELIGSEYLKSSRLEGVDSFFKLCFGALCGNALIESAYNNRVGGYIAAPVGIDSLSLNSALNDVLEVGSPVNGG